MSGDALKWCRTQYPTRDGRPEPMAKLLLLTVCSNADDHRRSFWGENALLETTMLGRDKLRSCKALLIAQGYVTVQRRYNSRVGTRKSDEWFVNLDRPADQPPGRPRPKNLRTKVEQEHDRQARNGQLVQHQEAEPHEVLDAVCPAEEPPPAKKVRRKPVRRARAIRAVAAEDDPEPDDDDKKPESPGPMPDPEIERQERLRAWRIARRKQEHSEQ